MAARRGRSDAAEATRLVRQAMDQVNPQAVLTTEHPGYDFLLPHIEGCITYDLTVLASPLRPVEVNLQRFLFPECKAFELDHRGADPKHRKRFWNAVGSFGSYYPPPYDAILRENEDAFASRQCRPLVPTLVPGVYAHWFRGEGKEIYTVYNGTGHTFHGLALSVELPPERHVFDLLRCEDADIEPADGQQCVRLFLPRDEVACLAVLPRKLAVTTAGDRLAIRADGAEADSRVALCDRDGKPIATAALTDGKAELPLGAADSQKACVKLYRAGRLWDAAACPVAE